jgi:flagellar biosynthetic protein FliR
VSTAVEHYALPVQVYGAGLIFARVGALVMFLPGMGESAVPAAIRLAFAFVLCLMLYPLLAASLPPVPTEFMAGAGALATEVLIGLAIGSILRMFLNALNVAGEIVSLQTTLSFAQTTNPLQAQPTETVTSFLTVFGLTLIFATGLHQLFIGAIVHSFSLFPAGHLPKVADFNAAMVRAVSESFALGVQLAAPVVVFGLIFNVALGLIGRVMPQFQVFFAGTPLNVLLGLGVFGLSLGGLGLVWIEHFRAFVERWA